MTTATAEQTNSINGVDLDVDDFPIALDDERYRIAHAIIEDRRQWDEARDELTVDFDDDVADLQHAIGDALRDDLIDDEHARLCRELSADVRLGHVAQAEAAQLVENKAQIQGDPFEGGTNDVGLGVAEVQAQQRPGRHHDPGAGAFAGIETGLPRLTQESHLQLFARQGMGRRVVLRSDYSAAGRRRRR